MDSDAAIAAILDTVRRIPAGRVTSYGEIAARAGLKGRARLVPVPREAPLNLAHLRNLTAVTEMGGIVYPPVPAFYARLKSLDDMVAHTVARILDLFGIHSKTLARWKGLDGD